MKKLITAAIAATMVLTMSVTSFASFSNLGNFVTATQELEPTVDEEEPVDEETNEDIPNYLDVTTEKPNPSTGAGNLDILIAAAGLLTVAGVIVMKK